MEVLNLKNLKCSKCRDVPEKEIFQCKNGHSVCHMCVSNSSNCCPECQEPMEVRNRALESSLDSIDFECKFQVIGCTQTYNRGELKEHIKKCDYRDILLCQMIGYESCQFVPSEHSRSEILEHFSGDSHKDVLIHNGRFVQISREDIVSVERGTGEYCWGPTLMNFENNETGPLYLILSSTSDEKNFTSWLCLLLWTDKQPNDSTIFANFAFKSVTNGIPDIQLTLPAIHILQPKSDDIPLKVRTSDYLSETGGGRDVVVEVTLTRRNVPKVNAEVKPTEIGVFGPRTRSKTSKLNGASTSQPILDRVPVQTPVYLYTVDNDSDDPFAYFCNRKPFQLYCNNCKTKPIQGILHKCAQCLSYHLCPNCVQDRSHHKHQIFVLICNREHHGRVLNYLTRSKSELLNKKAGPMDADNINSITEDFTCAICCKKTTISECLYRCMSCANSFICSNCFDQDQDHSQKHVFATTTGCEPFKLLHDNWREMADNLGYPERTD